MIKIFRKTNWAISFRIIIILLFQLLIGVILIFIIEFSEINQSLETKLKYVQEDISFNGQNWDLNRYSSDSRLLGYFPLYIIDKQGFILDRRTNISGFLDTSDFSDLLKYSEPQTITTLTGVKRRIYSRKITNSANETLGVVVLSIINPIEENINTTDQKLIINLNYLLSKIKIIDNKINVSEVDSKQIPFDISFNLVDRFNTVLLKNANVNNFGRTPNNIDPSYYKSIIYNEQKIVRDQSTGEIYLLKTKVYYDQHKVDQAIIIIGNSLNQFIHLIYFYFISSGICSIIFYLIWYLFITNSNLLVKKVTSIKIYFDPKKSLLYIDNTTVKIPYATNQYYLIKILLSNPQKQWETDEIFDKFGDQNIKYNWRKIYDTMVMLNKKVFPYIQDKLIINEDKIYHLNPKYFKELSQR